MKVGGRNDMEERGGEAGRVTWVEVREEAEEEKGEVRWRATEGEGGGALERGEGGTKGRGRRGYRCEGDWWGQFGDGWESGYGRY